METRLLEPADVYAALGIEATDPMPLPPLLVDAYVAVLGKRGWLDYALAAKPGGRIGGASLEEAKEYFCTEFRGSCARTFLGLVDPKGRLTRGSDALVSAFSGGRLGILDAPCGAGAASAVLLAACAALRAARMIPWQPLDVFVTGGEWSEHSRGIALDLWSALEEPLAAHGVFLHHRAVPWDATKMDQTIDCLNAWVSHSQEGHCTAHLVLIANASGFLSIPGKWDQAKGQVEHVLQWSRARGASVVWVEPGTNQAIDRWPDIVRALRATWSAALHACHLELLVEPPKTEASYVDPLLPTESRKAQLTIRYVPGQPWCSYPQVDGESGVVISGEDT